jgi:nicotinate-nucleotide adenylyltransferase
MNIGLFGGSFDPIHRGHLALAQAAAGRYSLRQVLFVPANVPPHKQLQPLSPFMHRYAMVALATQEERGFVPSLLEAPGSPAAEFFNPAKLAPPSVGMPGTKASVAKTSVAKALVAKALAKKSTIRASEEPGGAASAPVNYSIDTVRLLKTTLKKSDRLFFLIGIDAFRDIAKWREARALLAECDFVVASRPGFSLRDVAESLPEDLRPPSAVTRPFHKQPATGDLILPGVTVHLLEGVHQTASATVIRAAAAQGKPLTRWLDAPVADYIRKQDLYRERIA